MDMRSPTLQMWWTAQELADAATAGLLPDMPTSKRGINDLAAREGWSRYHSLIRLEKGRGGSTLRYHLELLPLHVRIAYLARSIGVEGGDVGRPVPSGENLNDRQRLERDARLAIVRMAERFRRLTDLTAKAADTLFAEVYNSGRLDLPGWLSETIDTLSVRSLARWRGKDAAGEAVGHDPSLNRKGSGLLETANDGKVKLTIIAWIARNPALSAETIRGYIEDEYGPELIDRSGELKPLPSPRTFQLFMKGLKEAENVVLTKITNPDKYRSHHKLVGTGAYSWVSEPNQMWMIDASPFDVKCIDGRYSIYGCIDVASRRYVITLSRTPRASAVGLMIRKATLLWGVAKIIKTDNGSDFKAYEVQRLFHSLAITPDISHAYSPAEKGHIERAIRTFQHEVGPQLPGYLGHNVAERKAIEERRSFADRLGASDDILFEVSLTAAELQVQIDDWLEHRYHHRKHGGIGMTPAEAAAASTAEVRRVDERALDVLLMPTAHKDGWCTMTKQGIKIDHNYYMTGRVLAGTRVFVRLDPIDMGKAYVFAEAGEFIDIALCPKLCDINRTDFVRAKKQEYAEMVSTREKEIKAEVRRLQKGPTGLERTIRLAKRKTEEREAASANVIRLPKREVRHTTPAIEAALDAITPPPAPSRRPLTETQAELMARLAAEMHAGLEQPAPNVRQLRSQPTKAQLFNRALDLDARITAGEAVTPDDVRWLNSYKDTSDYRARKRMHDDFGDQAPVLRT